MTDQSGLGGDDLAYRDFRDAVDSVAASAGPILVLVESADGRAGQLLDLIPPELGEPVKAEGGV